MNLQARFRWILLLSCFLVVVAFVGPVTPAGAAGFVGTNTCIDCHSTWADNDPPVADMTADNASTDYVPLNLLSTHAAQPFYTIPEAYTFSIHNITAFNLVDQDYVKCEGCHGSGIAHFGIGQIPVPIPQAKTCGTCHNDAHGFDLAEFMETAHANQAKDPGKYFDQPRNGTKQATQTRPSFGTVLLYQQGTFGPVGGPVSRNMRIQECSVCHSYALNYPQFEKKIAQGNMPNPQVSCGACHDSHIVAPDGLQPVVVGDTVKVTSAFVSSSGSVTVTGVAPVQGRSTYPLNHKPFRVNESGAQAQDGIWSRGSAVARPSIAIVSGPPNRL